MNICAYCGTSFDGRKRKYCSRECGYSSYKDKMRMEYIGKREQQCVVCGKPLPKFKTRYCSDGCSRQAEIAKRGNSEAHGILTKTCVICGKEFSTYKSRQKTCSTECSKIRSNKLSNVLAKKKRHEAGGRTREEIHEEAIKRKEAAEKKKAENIAYWLEFSERRVCECCGKEYIAHYPTSKYCSDKCSRHVSKEKRKYAGCLVDSDITLRRLAQRDDNICQICGLMVDWSDKMKAKGTVICGPMYPSIDHICPISKGGMHAWDNVQLVHRKCNSYKRDSIA